MLWAKPTPTIFSRLQPINEPFDFKSKVVQFLISIV